MADLGTVRQINPTRLGSQGSQLPVSWYFDPKIFELEKKLLFAAGANYVDVTGSSRDDIARA